MLKIETTSRFDNTLKSFLKAHPDARRNFDKLLQLLIKNPFNPKCRTHRLSGKLHGFHAASINHSYRLVFELKAESLLLVNIGNHDDVY